MKKLILVLAAIAITVGVYAQTDSANRKMNQHHIINPNDDLNQNRNMNHDQIQDMQNYPCDKSNPDGVMMKNGKLMKVKNGEMTILDEDMTMSNGTKVMRDGNYINKDGTKLMLEEGQHMDMSGRMISVKTNEDKNMYLVPDSTRKND